MTLLDSIKPTKKPTVMELVRSAGIDVSDWSNMKNGATKAASNPNYCYRWSFLSPGKVVVLNEWHRSMEEKSGTIKLSDNMRGVNKSKK